MVMQDSAADADQHHAAHDLGAAAGDGAENVASGQPALDGQPFRSPAAKASVDIAKASKAVDAKVNGLDIGRVATLAQARP